MPRQQVVAIMNGFTQALGVNCAHCHTEAPPAVPGVPPARQMMQRLGINPWSLA